MTKAELFDKLNKNFKYYQIVELERVIGEEGTYVDTGGYGLYNKITEVIEHTSLMLPGVVFQAQHFENTLESLTAEPVALKGVDVDGDVVPGDFNGGEGKPN